MLKLEQRPQASRFWTYGSPILALLITKISIIIMETEMAEFDGFDTTIILRRKIASETQPIIIAYTNELSIKEKALKVGMNDVVCKTMDSNLLLQKIKDWLPKN